MPLAHLVDPFKQVKLFVTEEHEVETSNGEKGGSTGEMVVEENDEEEMREIEVANVTRAGCEKANVNQFELLRVLGQVRLCSMCNWLILQYQLQVNVYCSIFTHCLFCLFRDLSEKFSS